MLLVLIVAICLASIQYLVHSAKKSNTKSFFDGKACCMCGDEATKNMGLDKFYCDDCFDKEYGDLPIKSGPAF